MKYLMLILIAASTVASAGMVPRCGGDGITYGCYMFWEGEREDLTPRLTLPGIVVGDIFTKPQPQKRVPQEPPSAQYLEILAQAEARAKEATKQWWVDFFNNTTK